jgi:hypothetical protein
MKYLLKIDFEFSMMYGIKLAATPEHGETTGPFVEGFCVAFYCRQHFVD